MSASLHSHPCRNLARLYGQDMRCGHEGLYDALRIAIHHYSIHPPFSYLEIGVSDGASLMTVLDHSIIRQLVLCDLWEPVEGGSGRGSHDHISALLTLRNYKGEVQFLDGDSHILIPKLDPAFMADLITVDGDHTFAGATADLENVWPHLELGGILIFDDLTRGDLTQVWEQFNARHRLEPLFKIDDGADVTVVARRVE